MKSKKNKTFLALINNFHFLIIRNFSKFMRTLYRLITNLKKLISFR